MDFCAESKIVFGWEMSYNDLCAAMGLDPLVHAEDFFEAVEDALEKVDRDISLFEDCSLDHYQDRIFYFGKIIKSRVRFEEVIQEFTENYARIILNADKALPNRANVEGLSYNPIVFSTEELIF